MNNPEVDELSKLLPSEGGPYKDKGGIESTRGIRRYNRPLIV